MKWITREKVKVDRVACPWLIRKFVDREAEFLFVPAALSMSATHKNIFFDQKMPDVTFPGAAAQGPTT